ncbi:hypothetical protein CKA32_001190 [Geitlerinema sp. FC II]|nr:hypothetical protein CKA32_001190 [Geitlerinema sp. FC II]
MIPHHPLHRQVFHHEGLVFTHQAGCQFVQVVAPSLFDLFVNFSNLATCPLSIPRTLHLTRESFLSASQAFVVFCQVAGIFHLFSIAGDGEMSDSHIDTNAFLGLGKWLDSGVVHQDGDVPTSRGCESHRDGRGFCSFGELSTPSDVERFLAFGQIQRTVFPTKCRFGKFSTTSIPFLFEPWVFGSSGEKVGISPIEMAQSLLERNATYFPKKLQLLFLLPLRQHLRGFAISYLLLSLFPGLRSRCQRFVVDKPHATHCPTQEGILLESGIEAISESSQCHFGSLAANV